MKTIEYNWNGTNELSDFVEGAKIVFPGCGVEYIDSIEPSKKKGKLVMKSLYEISPSSNAFARKHEVGEHTHLLELDDLGKNVLNAKSIMVSYSVEGQSTDYAEKLTRLRELQGGRN